MSMNMDDEYLPLRDVVFNTLRQEILTGKLKPGDYDTAQRCGGSTDFVEELKRRA